MRGGDTMSAAAQALRGRSVLVTGGLGFIGSNLARALAEAGCARVVVVDSLDPSCGGTASNLDGVDGVEVHRADIGDLERVRPLVENVDVVFNLAAHIGHLASMRAPRHDLALNCTAQLGLLEACRARGSALRIVYTSTRQVYGAPRFLPVDETHPTEPPDINGVHKLAIEHYHRLHAHTTGAQVVCLRLTNVYGPRQRLIGAAGVVPTFLARVLRGEPIALFGGGAQRRDLVYIDDVVDVLCRAATVEAAAGETLNVGRPQGVPLRELAERLIALVGRGSVAEMPMPVEQAAVEIGSYATDARRCERVLGWRPSVELDDGLARTIAFYRAHEAEFLP
jgi:UDP-glucose 4-epimerase